MAVKNDAIRAMNVKPPRVDPTAAGWEKLAPFLMTAEKQAISVLEEFEKNLSIKVPSKSGIPKAIGGIAETSDDDTGMTAPPVIGTLAFNGQRLPKFALHGLKTKSNLSSP